MDREKTQRNPRVDRTWGRARKELELTGKMNEEERKEKSDRREERKDDRKDERRRDRCSSSRSAIWR